MSTWVLLAACAKPKEPPPAPVAARASHITVDTTQIEGLAVGMLAGDTERAAIKRVIGEAEPAVAVCYQRAIQKEPYTWGTLELGFTIDADGEVDEVAVRLSTVPDRDLERCVVGVVEKLEFPRPSEAGLRVSYPFLFTSDLTPAPIVRALEITYGLRDPDMETQDYDGRSPPARGEQGWWESW